MTVYKGLKYYKYINWTQPILSNNGTMGGNTFACNQSSYLNTNRLAWKAFDEDNQIYEDNWHSANGHPAYIEWYNPNPLKISNIKIRNRDSDGSFINEYAIYYSDDNSNWVWLQAGNSTNQTAYSEWNISINTDAHKYWRLVCHSSSGNNNGYTAIQHIALTATEMVTGTSSDYDYSEIQKINEIYKSGTKISKIYKGSQLVYQSIIGLPIYGFQNRSLLGDYNTTGCVIHNDYNYHLTSINGNLGQSGSTVTVDGVGSATYNNMSVYNGIKVYVYSSYSGIGAIYTAIYILENSIVGSNILYMLYTSYTGYHPSSVTDTSMRYGDNTYSRDSSLDKTWTINGVY